MTPTAQQNGRLVLIVGPSGAGKDTLIAYARQALANESRIRFVQRTITRPPSVGEDHVPMDEAGFEQAAAQGAFALNWAAHGLRYGLPVVINQWLAEGDVVVANGSRAILGEARARYPALTVVNVAARPEVLAARLARRARETGDGQKSRMARTAEIPTDLSDAITIDNSGEVETAATRLIEVVRPLPQNGMK